MNTMNRFFKKNEDIFGFGIYTMTKQTQPDMKSLIKKIIIMFSLVPIILGLLILIPAGTFNLLAGLSLFYNSSRSYDLCYILLFKK